MRTYDWAFPLPRTHTGMLQGNGTLGAMIWGEENILRITLNRADFWDHRGGRHWDERITYNTIQRLLLENNEQELRSIFQRTPPPGEPDRPSVLPLGRLELIFAPTLKLVRGTLHLDSGEVIVQVIDDEQVTHEIAINLSMQEPVLHVQFPSTLAAPHIQRVPAWEYVGTYLQSISFQPPTMLDKETIQGWVQERPVDPPLCLGYRQIDNDLWITAVYGKDAVSAVTTAVNTLDTATTGGASDLLRQNEQWWSQYWADVPQLTLSNEKLTFLYYYGMYKFAGFTAPQGVPATLQGPWVEEYQMPPWSSDYHFNINVQMCYWPAYQGNHLQHLRPLFEMIWNWRETLRQNARYFVGIDDGFMLPHAVDDRCVIIGSFWSGTIDHGCTAWVGKMMYDYWRYSGDREFLRNIAYPFMVGAMRVYEAMLQRDGDHFVLPVSVSPEYRGSRMDSWGANASFQLACIHWLCEALRQAAEVLGEEPRSLWHEIQQNLPRACVEGEADNSQIMLWQHTPLEESHRHHSHLAGLVPFDVLPLDDPTWRPIIERSIRHWIKQGMGQWSGWCMPWAAMLHTRMGNADAAELILEIWQRVFTNEGHGTLHDASIPGFSLMGTGRPNNIERMQMDAGMSGTAAIMDMLLHTRKGVHYLFTGAPEHWRNVSFSRVRTDGGFLVSAQRSNGIVNEIQVQSTWDSAPFRLAMPRGWDRGAIVMRGESREEVSGAITTITMHPGETIMIIPN